MVILVECYKDITPTTRASDACGFQNSVYLWFDYSIK